MIISHEHECIFVHCRKTAGSAITALMNPYLGPNDVQIGVWDDALRNGGRFNRFALQILARKSPDIARRTVKDILKGRKPKLSRYANPITRALFHHHHGFGCSVSAAAHPLAVEVMEYDETAWKNYFKFSIVRNPWTHAISDYYWRRKVSGAEYVDFIEFLRRTNNSEREDPEGIAAPIRSNWGLYTLDNEIAVDYVGHFETLQDDLDEVGKRIGIPLNLSKVRAKSGVRDRDRRIVDHYDEEAMALVADIYEKEIAAFGYETPF